MSAVVKEEALSQFAQSMRGAAQLLFVYGTLKRSQLANHVLGGAEYIGACSIPGVLLHLGPFPGLIHHDQCRVTGEVYRVSWNDLVGRIDTYESVGSGLYQRRQVKVPFAPELAWAYYKQNPPTLNDMTLCVERGIWIHASQGRIPYKDLLDYFMHQRWREPANRLGPQPIIGAVPSTIPPDGKPPQLMLPVLKEEKPKVAYKDILVEPGLELLS